MEYTKERAMEWLNKNWHTPKACAVCHNNNWIISDSLVEIHQLFTDGLLRSGGPVYPLFLVTCGVCGYTLFFNSVIAGFTLEAPKKNGEKDAVLEEKDSK